MDYTKLLELWITSVCNYSKISREEFIQAIIFGKQKKLSNKFLRLNGKNIRDMMLYGFSYIQGDNLDSLIENLKKAIPLSYFSILQAYCVNSTGLPGLFRKEFDPSKDALAVYVDNAVRASKDFMGVYE